MANYNIWKDEVPVDFIEWMKLYKESKSKRERSSLWRRMTPYLVRLIEKYEFIKFPFALDNGIRSRMFNMRKKLKETPMKPVTETIYRPDQRSVCTQTDFPDVEFTQIIKLKTD